MTDSTESRKRIARIKKDAIEVGCYDNRDKLIAFCLGEACGSRRAVAATTTSENVERCPLTNLQFKKENRKQHYQSLLHAATATSICQSKCRVLSTAFKMRSFFKTCGNDKLSGVLRVSLDEDPMLILERSVNVQDTTIPIGWTALHVAVWSGAFECCELLLSRGANPFECDLTGRLPLHILAASEKKKKSHMKICESLLRIMRQDSSGENSLVGDDAPTDLAGLTPSAWLLASATSKKKMKCADVVRQLKTIIHSPGDRCISPFPSRKRGIRRIERKIDDCVRVGHFELRGWNIHMEDAVLICTDFDTKRKFSFFGVFDGHGGSNCANFCTEHFPKILKSNLDSLDVSNSFKETSLMVDQIYRDLTEKNKSKNDESGAVGVTVRSPAGATSARI